MWHIIWFYWYTFTVLEIIIITIFYRILFKANSYHDWNYYYLLPIFLLQCDCVSEPRLFKSVQSDLSGLGYHHSQQTRNWLNLLDHFELNTPRYIQI